MSRADGEFIDTLTLACSLQEVQYEIRAMRQSLQYLQMLVKADQEEVASFREVSSHPCCRKPFRHA